MEIVTDSAVKSAPNYNEAEIRFHVIDPILRKLGYPGAEDVYLKLEEKLEYPYIHIGHRSKRDLPVGYPDYRAGLKGARGSFIVEAKAGPSPIGIREVEQAHSYAAHAHVGAQYFVLCNGNIITVYQTLSGSNAPPIAAVRLDELNDRFHELENILSPAQLAKNCNIKHDTGLKICEGLGSGVRIRSGRYVMSNYGYRMLVNGQDLTENLRQEFPHFTALDQQLELLKTAFELRVSGGTAERGKDGLIRAHIEFAGATVHNNQAMAILGIKDTTFVTSDKFISIDQKNPSVFESVKDFAVPRGTSLPELFGGSSVIETDVNGDMFIKTAVYYCDNDKLKGQYITLSNQTFSLPGAKRLDVEMEFAGTCELVLDV